MKPMWQDASGARYPIACMSDMHIANSIAFLRRRGWISVAEMGDMPTNPTEQIVWASLQSNPLLDMLAVEKLRRIEHGISVTDDEAEVLKSSYGQRRPSHQPSYDDDSWDDWRDVLDE